jgi:hypothetical protein
LIAHGYKKITTSNKTNNIATKYFTENGILISNRFNTTFKILPLLQMIFFGPSPETIMVPTTNPTTRTNCIKIGI